jgi:uncharacterized protein YkwD
MARRPTPRAILKLERLENREVLSSGGPSAQAQAMLELTNFARQHPAEAASWAGSDLQTDNLGLTLSTFHVDLNAARQAISSKPVVQPLAWNDSLAKAATVQSEFQAETGTQTHSGGGTLADGTVVGVTMDDRISNAGYIGRTVSGENAFAYATSVSNAMNAFLIDWGNDPAVKPHLTNLFRGDYSEVGIGIVATSNKGLGPNVITQDFASRAGQKPMLLGVAYNDSVKADNFYEAGEGVGNVLISVTDSQGHVLTVQTWDAGGYQIALDPGNYTVTASVGNQIVRSQSVSIGNQNVKVDFNLAQAWSGATLNSPVAAPAPVAIVVTPPAPIVKVTPPAPAPVVVPTRVVIVSTPTPAPVVAPVPTPTVTLVGGIVTALNSSRVTMPAVIVPVVTSPIVLPAIEPVNPLNSANDIQWQSWS